MTDHSMPRRTVLKAGLGAIASLGLPACSTNDPTEPRTDPPATDPAADPGGTVPQPAGMVRTSWSTDPWTLGSYSYLPVGATPQHRADLATPIDDRLVFAGEALDPDNPSTVHGALASGLAAAALADEALDPGATIVVVGAGIAGAAAARALTDAGHTVVVVEAQQRVGGRTFTVRPDGWPVPVERGASWVHDTAASDLATELAALDVATAAFEYNDIVLDPNGTLADGSDMALEAAIDWADGQDADLSLADALEQSGAAAEVDSASLQHFLRTEISTEYGADADELSAWWGTAEGSEGDDLLVLGGYDALVTSRLDGLDVRLGWQVANIATGGEQATVTSGTGESLTADAVIVTVPLGVLKAGGITFRPPLPATHTAAIEAIGMGVLDKIWLRWDEPWWSQSAQQWTRVAATDDAFVEWFNLLDVAGAPVLLGLLGGAEARAWAARTDEAVLAAALASLQQFHAAGW
jgi:monoamine oxidase